MCAKTGDDDLFAQAMGAVKPITSPTKVQARKRPPRAHEVTGKLHTAAHHVIPTNMIPIKQTDQPETLLADGISRERLKRFRAGDPPVACHIDLHGVTCDAALTQLEQVFIETVANKERSICIVHGRGLHSGEGKPVLKQAVYHWLREGPFAGHILAITPQPGSRGGACLVLLRRQ